MAIIIKSDLETADSYAGMKVTALVGKKKHQAYFKVAVDDFSLEGAIDSYKNDSNIVALNYVGNDEFLRDFDRAKLQGVYLLKEFEVGSDVSEDDINCIVNSVHPEVTAVIRVPEDFCDMKFIQDMSKAYRNICFCGGTLFMLEDCKIGCCSKEVLENRGISVKDDEYIKTGCCSALQIVNLGDFELTATVKAEKRVRVPKITSSSRSTSTKKSKETKPKAPKELSMKAKMSALVGRHSAEL